ncbi:hypothetical protein FF80_03311 [Devosia sp. LC5]|uniref:hypothetical protein n=1 Tax=Devosia sp. LC5 TaxID=1502724 RepID=UPI0004E2CD79|nr:hypothetical protein [Devosia sp. LC5]KFC62744.1 hypothetical protein FF80_03311 [Devosia sp. LC5]
MNAKTIRDALTYEARNNLSGISSFVLLGFAEVATDAELLRFAQLINNAVDGSERMIAPPMDSTEIARANAD